MTKHTMLGVNGNYCCILYCLLPFDELDLDKLESSDFMHGSTNWNGCDTIDRTLVLKRLKKTDRKHELKSPLAYKGKDYDCGHEYPWKFEVTEIWEVIEDGSTET